MTASRGISIKGIDLTNIGGDGIKPWRTRNHFRGHPLFSIVYSTWNTAKKAWIIVGGGTEYIPLLV